MTWEVKGSGSDVFTDEGEDDHDALSATERSTSSAVCYSNSAFHLQNDHNHTHSSQQDLVAASIHPLNIKNDHLTRHTHQQEATRDVPHNCLKCWCTTALTGFASAPTTISAVFESAHLEDVQLRVPISSLDQGLILHNIGQDLCDNDTITDSHCKSSSGLSDAVGPKKWGRPSWKQVGRATNTKRKLEASTGASLSSSQVSEDIPVQRYLTLWNMKSKVEYCLTFSQELPHLHAQKQDRTADLEESQTITDLNHQWEICKITGQKLVSLERQYQVRWKNTWMFKFKLSAARELINVFKADHIKKTKSRKQQLKQDQSAEKQQNAHNENKWKKQQEQP